MKTTCAFKKLIQTILTVNAIHNWMQRYFLS